MRAAAEKQPADRIGIDGAARVIDAIEPLATVARADGKANHAGAREQAGAVGHGKRVSDIADFVTYAATNGAGEKIDGETAGEKLPRLAAAIRRAGAADVIVRRCADANIRHWSRQHVGRR